ncbi:Glycosyltransferase involved in cell wall bisynthesis [Hydrobacter penzbergensis]|jgi:glucosyl-dolichyl phosphate glucuronosyltransferase|uniref:Glycosyltransferase involved in cell wall bisynthesis n=1 Tax=Hydrobacter penzbergensis TaxID=1235997 RepID=A0A8X8ICI2_9BACT|nr:glycosyltransferase [Hydrobacter penzbergensis]SDW08952.1 Glycosyltransferase involved in cell wall bisynthesis [Hydrobacter penzbergensis]
MSTMPKISVVVCTYNRADYIVDAMESLYRQSLDKQYYEVIIVNNNSSDNTTSICDAYIAAHPDASFQFLNEPKQGASFARNTGAALSKSPLLCFMDDDAIAAPDYLERIVSFFDQHADAIGLGGRIIPRYIPSEPAWMSYYVSSLVGNFDYAQEVTLFKPGKYPLESNMIVRKAYFIRVNGFNTALPGVAGTLRIGGEGKEFFFKLQALGGNIYYNPSICVEHVVEVKKLTPEYMYRIASGIGRGEQVRVKAIGRMAYYKKIIEYFFKLGASVVLGILYTLQGNPAKAKPVIQFRIDALKGLFDSRTTV